MPCTHGARELLINSEVLRARDARSHINRAGDFKYCDGKLVDDLLSDEGDAFAGCYYGDDGLFLDDYADAFEEHMSVAPESAHDFAKFS